MILRDAGPHDAAAIASIYAPYVLTGAATFEVDPPAAEEMEARRAAVAASALPWLVAETGGEVIGYGYACAFRPRPGYRWTAEDTVYVAQDRTGRGVGRRILEAVIERCRLQGVRRMAAAVGDSGNAASVALHRACGYEVAGVLRRFGFKHGRWIDVVLMQRDLDDDDRDAPPTGPGWA